MADNPEQSVRQQIEYYFSRDNLATDTYMASVMDHDRWISLDVIAKFPKLLSLTKDHDVIVAAARAARNCQVDSAGKRIRPYAPRDTIILRDIRPDADEAVLRALFKPAEGAEDAVVSMRSEVGNTWFVQLAGEAEAQEALRRLRDATYNGEPVKARMKSASVAVAALPPPSAAPMGFGVPGMGMGMGLGGGAMSMGFMNMLSEGMPDMLSAMAGMQGMDLSGAAPGGAARKPSSRSGSGAASGRARSRRPDSSSATRAASAAVAAPGADVPLGGDLHATFAADAGADGRSSSSSRRRDGADGRGPSRRRDGADGRRRRDNDSADGAGRRSGGRGRRDGNGRRSGGAEGGARRGGRRERTGSGAGKQSRRAGADGKAGAEAASQPVAALSSAMHFPPLMRAEDLAAATASGYTARFNQFLKEDIQMLVRGVDPASLRMPASMQGHPAVVNETPNPALVNKARTDSMDIAVRRGRPIRAERAESLDYASMMYGENSDAVAQRKQAREAAAATAQAAEPGAAPAKRAPAPYAAALLSPAKPGAAGKHVAKSKPAAKSSGTPGRKGRGSAVGAPASGQAKAGEGAADAGRQRSAGGRGKAVRQDKAPAAPRPAASLGPRGWERPEVTEADRRAAKEKAERAAREAEAAKAAEEAERASAAAGAGAAPESSNQA